MPYVNGLGVVSHETALAHQRQGARVQASTADWVNDKPVSEFARQVDAECFRTGKRRDQVLSEFAERRRQMDAARRRRFEHS